VRKDLAYFGEFGVRGIGYYVAASRPAAADPGARPPVARRAGRLRQLGSALFHYKGFGRQGFRIAAIVDDDPPRSRARWNPCPSFRAATSRAR